MRIIFAGTPAFSVPTLKALLHSHHEIKLVLTQPDRPMGRGQHVQCSPVKTLAIAQGLNILQPHTLKNEEIQRLLKQQAADLMIVVAYGLLLPTSVLAIPNQGCINIHASLLPRWRGAAPIPYALLAGDKETGVTIMKMDEGLDTGDMLLQSTFPITSQDTSESLHDRLAQLGANLLINTLSLLKKNGRLKGEKQNNAMATYAGKITKAHAKLDWKHPAVTLERQVRAFNPWPISYFHLNGISIRVWKADVIASAHHAPPGTLVSVTPEHLYIACEEGLFSPRSLQFPSRSPIDWKAVYNSRRSLFMEGAQLPS